jgi:hypothetical protein
VAGKNTLAFWALLLVTKKKFYDLTPDEGDVETDGQGSIFKTNGQFQMSDTKRHKFKWVILKCPNEALSATRWQYQSQV